MIEITLRKKGKVRDIYFFAEEYMRNMLFMLFSDRVSANDQLLDFEINNKGKVLWSLTVFWKEHFSSIIDSDIAFHNQKQIGDTVCISNLKKNFARMLIVRKTIAIPMECIVRGYFTGSFAKAYQRGEIWTQGFSIASSIQGYDKFEKAIFTPSTKGDKDLYLPKEQMIEFLNTWLAAQRIDLDAEEFYNQLCAYSLKIYGEASKYTDEHGIILADLKLEFGLLKNGNGSYKIIWIDEGITPDTARFWIKETYGNGKAPISIDKDPIRKSLQETGEVSMEVRQQVESSYMMAAKMLLPSDMYAQLEAYCED
jgi:phosphoribosylaminoimidazole-succinocarboxamide synthase